MAATSVVFGGIFFFIQFNFIFFELSLFADLDFENL